MDIAVNDKSAVNTSGGVQESSIVTWFKWAEALTTGLGSKAEWNASEENNFDAVLHSLVNTLHHRPSDKISDELCGAIENNPVKPPIKLAYQQAHQVALETIGLFLLERLASCEDLDAKERAFDLAEQLRTTTTPRSIFGAQLELFQMSLVDGNSELATRNHEEWGNRGELTKTASAPRSINPTTFTADVYRRADNLMANFFKRDSAQRLDAA